MPNAVRQRWEGHWDQFVGRVKRVWAGITDEDLAKVQGDYERVVEVIHERTGEQREQIERRLCESS
jgi:uncharacterized protein YjbJ (UPF0337 family)